MALSCILFIQLKCFTRKVWKAPLQLNRKHLFFSTWPNCQNARQILFGKEQYKNFLIKAIPILWTHLTILPLKKMIFYEAFISVRYVTSEPSGIKPSLGYCRRESRILTLRRRHFASNKVIEAILILSVLRSRWMKIIIKVSTFSSRFKCCSYYYIAFRKLSSNLLHFWWISG